MSMWLSHLDFCKVADKARSIDVQINLMHRTMVKLEDVKTAIKFWNSKVFSECEREI